MQNYMIYIVAILPVNILRQTRIIMRLIFHADYSMFFKLLCVLRAILTTLFGIEISSKIDALLLFIHNKSILKILHVLPIS